MLGINPKIDVMCFTLSLMRLFIHCFGDIFVVNNEALVLFLLISTFTIPALGKRWYVCVYACVDFILVHTR